VRRIRSRSSGLIFFFILIASEELDDPLESSVDALQH